MEGSRSGIQESLYVSNGCEGPRVIQRVCASTENAGVLCSVSTLLRGLSCSRRRHPACAMGGTEGTLRSEVSNLNRDSLFKLTLWKMRLEYKKAGKNLDPDAAAYEGGVGYDSLSGATRLAYDALSDVIEALTKDEK
jgi:hypothetical protein